MAPHQRRPSIFQVGKVRDDGHTVAITGWGVGLCAAGCHCHRHPTGGQLAMDEDQTAGTLGLRCFRVGGCDCCRPWEAHELMDFIAALNDVELMGREPLPDPDQP